MRFGSFRPPNVRSIPPWGDCLLKITAIHRETFNASHTVDGDFYCGKRNHGHDWYAEAAVAGEPAKESGAILTSMPILVQDAVGELDLKLANDMLPGVHPTPEGIAMWLFERLRLECPGLISVTVGFTGHSAKVEV